MELFSLILMIVILIVIVNQHSKTSLHLKRLEDELKLLRRRLPDEKKQDEIKKETPPQAAPELTPYKSLFSVPGETSSGKETADQEKTQAEPIKEPLHKDTEPVFVVDKLPEKRDTAGKEEQKVHAPGFFEQHPDMEKFIGENLVSKIGIAVLVLAIGFFVKYAIDQNWIGPVARVAVGILCGGILITLAHRFRNIYRGFSSVLAGGGLAVFYFTITLAFQQFHLFSQSVAFIIMIVITIFAAILSLLYNKQELAIIALVGGFMAPFLVSTGEGNYRVLFTYLIILNSGLLVIAYHKAWRSLNFLNFIFTVLIFGSWLFFLKFSEPSATYRNAFLFAGIFYLQFFVINIVHNTREKKKFITSDFSILLANTALFFGTGIYCLHMMGAESSRGLFSASMGVFNLVVSYFLFRKQKVDSNILYLLIGITLTFISITAPIQLHGNYITIFWASETVLLYWLFTKSKLRIIQYSSVIVWALMLISLLMDWSQVYFDIYFQTIPVIANKGFITTLYAGLGTYALFLIRSREDEAIRSISSQLIPSKNLFRIIAIVIFFCAGALEINHQFRTYYPGTGINSLYLLLYCIAFINLVVMVSQKVQQLKLNRKLTVVMLSACILLYMSCIAKIFSVQQQMLSYNTYGFHFISHWITAILIGFSLYKLIFIFRNNKVTWDIKEGPGFVTWILCAATVIYLSVEAHLAVNSIFFSPENSLGNIQRIYIKTGLPILWGLCSFAFMWLGMHYRFRMLRIISLSLFTLTLLKLFIFDIRNIPAAGKIAAFFCLGILLLVVSFMYQKLKKIIIDDEEKMA